MLMNSMIQKLMYFISTQLTLILQIIDCSLLMLEVLLIHSDVNRILFSLLISFSVKPCGRGFKQFLFHITVQQYSKCTIAIAQQFQASQINVFNHPHCLLNKNLKRIKRWQNFITILLDNRFINPRDRECGRDGIWDISLPPMLKVRIISCFLSSGQILSIS